AESCAHRPLSRDRPGHDHPQFRAAQPPLSLAHICRRHSRRTLRAMTTPSTPLRQQYLDIKRRHADAILLFRIGDFYEPFADDARLLARELDIVLTSKPMGRGLRVPLAGVPHHSLERHLATLISRGHRVAICEQLTNAHHVALDEAAARRARRGAR